MHIDQRVKEVWLEDLEKERKELRSDCDDLGSSRVTWEERKKVLEDVVKNFEEQVAKGGRLEGARQILLREAGGELKTMESVLSKTEAEEREKSERLDFVEHLLWYVDKEVCGVMPK